MGIWLVPRYYFVFVRLYFFVFLQDIGQTGLQWEWRGSKDIYADNVFLNETNIFYPIAALLLVGMIGKSIAALVVVPSGKRGEKLVCIFVIINECVKRGGKYVSSLVCY